ncbi:MAG TPA: hypothetical protein VJA82_11275 [Sediminibacterium sp.]|uniref:hypothetical protein n=1 Tax=Sediminibacterium sp. TaxID=1917865 RepID=UPI0008C05441|nr:hypothetical protein [Sediminibacterium sp.]OHC84270.1 MAG: hypothetical protein A2472_12480 [Sphingobacteriia bacterium RIFOXYC2_FULL_35_18]OHC88780.1 MAG: hypothetical protein A2546_02705 [Sphingobacteriia bacterium RIFOXYD2_FULL_35_12]HLD53878.1 hypothetical protein [Sediminibacterium sp.]
MRYLLITIFVIVGILYPVPYLYALDNFERFEVGIKILGFIGYTVLIWEVAKKIFKSDLWKNNIEKKKG